MPIRAPAFCAICGCVHDQLSGAARDGVTLTVIVSPTFSHRMWYVMPAVKGKSGGLLGTILVLPGRRLVLTCRLSAGFLL